MGSVGCSESIVDVDLTQPSQAPAKTGIVPGFALMKTKVFQQQDLTVCKLFDLFFDFRTDAVRGKGYRLTEKFRKLFCDRIQAHGFNGLSIRPAEVGHEYGPTPLFDYPSDSGQRCLNSSRIDDVPILVEGNIEIGAHQNPAPLKFKIFNELPSFHQTGDCGFRDGFVSLRRNMRSWTHRQPKLSSDMYKGPKRESSILVIVYRVTSRNPLNGPSDPTWFITGDSPIADLLTEHILADLARGGFGKFLENHRFRDFESCQMITAEFDQILFTDTTSLLKAHEGTGRFPPSARLVVPPRLFPEPLDADIACSRFQPS